MDKCRLCLRVQKKMHSLYTNKGGITYCDMVQAISCIKINDHDEKLCITCCRKLVAAYNFKVMIEQSDVQLQNLSNTKRITFNTIEDIKVKIEIVEDDKKNVLKHDIIEQINSDDVEFKYNDILLRRKTSKKDSLTIKELFNTFDEGLDDSYDGYEVDVEFEPRDDHTDVDYVPGTKMMEKQKKSKPESKTKGSVRVLKKTKDMIFVEKPIKPKLYRNVKLKAEFCSRPKRNVAAQPKREKKRQVCPYCGKLFTNLECHILLHSGVRKFNCDYCPKSFFTAKHLAHHRVTHLPKTIRCDECIAVFATKSDLRSHKRVHSDVKKFVCELCSKAFKMRQQLLRHKAHAHNIGVKEYKCDQCNKTCKSPHLLKHHLRVHTGERPYKCEMCSQPYSYKHDFNRHCFKKHGVLFKRRPIYVMNEEVLMKERVLMRDLMLRLNGVIKEDVPLNPFEGVQAAQAYELITKALANKQIPIDFEF